MAITTNALDSLLYIQDGDVSSRWNFPDAVGSSTTAPAGIGNSVIVTFSFLSAAPSYFPVSGFLAFDEAQKQATRDVLSSIQEVANIDFIEAGGVAQITFAMSSQAAGQGGYAYLPSYAYNYTGTTITSVSEQNLAGDVWLNRNANWDTESWLPGHDGYGTLLHEIGHALGLKHPFESSTNGLTLISSLDDESHTVMSYTTAPHSRLVEVSGTSMSYSWTETFIQPSTLMPLDIEALQYLYGANTSTRTGNNVYQWSQNAELLETIWDGGGIDTINCSNQIFACNIDLRAGSYSSIALRQSDAEIRLGLDLPSWFTQPLATDIYNGSNNLAIAAGVVIENAFGGAGKDYIVGNAANNNLGGAAGNDTLNGGAGADTLDGGAGIDSMIGGDGNDCYYVRDIGDLVTETNASTSTGGADLVYSYLSDYTLTSNVEYGRIISTGTASFAGNSLNNLLYAGAGNNVLNGGTGVDTVCYAYGLTGITGVTVSLAAATAQTTGGSGSDTFISIENLTGSNYHDTLIGNAGANVLNGGSGADNMAGGDGNDIYYIDNVLDVASETNAVLTSGGSDTVYSTLSAHTLGANIENGRILAAGAANITGNALNNVLYAGAGSNLLNGSSGVDTAAYTNAGSSVTASLAVATAQVTGGSGSDTFISIENLTGSNYNDTLIGNAGANVLNGGSGADNMAGGDGNDIYYIDNVLDVASETNAVLTSGGSDTACSTLSAYTLGANIENGRILATGAASITGNALNNVLYAGTGANAIDGGLGTDSISYVYASTTGTAGVTLNLALLNSAGQATGSGISGSDLVKNIENITGSNYADSLTGNAGNNTVNGGLGNDVLMGGLGNDVLIGGAGQDTLTGGAGNDIFDFNALTEMGLTSTSWDQITDFVHGQDKIDLSTLDAITVSAIVNDTFSFIGTFSSTDASGQLRYVYDGVSTGMLYGSTDADSAAEFALKLIGVASMTATDFIL